MCLQVSLRNDHFSIQYLLLTCSYQNDFTASPRPPKSAVENEEKLTDVLWDVCSAVVRIVEVGTSVLTNSDI